MDCKEKGKSAEWEEALLQYRVTDKGLEIDDAKKAKVSKKNWSEHLRKDFERKSVRAEWDERGGRRMHKCNIGGIGIGGRKERENRDGCSKRDSSMWKQKIFQQKGVVLISDYRGVGAFAILVDEG